MVTNNTFIIIQARMTSTRLAGKVMLPLCGKSVLEIMLDRLERFKDNLIIATTNDGSEAPIVALCKDLHVKYYRGDMDNVLERYYEAATHFSAKAGDTIVRCTSDCPMIDPDIIKATIARQREMPHAYVSVDVTHSYPRGMDAEAFDFALLQSAYEHANDPYELEHVTPYIRSLDISKIVLNATHNDSAFRLTLDTPEDYEVISKLYEILGCDTRFDYDVLRAALYAHPDITALNAHIEQKKR